MPQRSWHGTGPAAKQRRGSHAVQQQQQLELDVTEVLFPCRFVLLRMLDSASLAAWRCVNRRAAADVSEASRSMKWQGGNAKHLQQLQSRRSAPIRPPTALPTALPACMASCNSLQTLTCARLTSLTTLHGLPPSLQHLDLTGCTAIRDLAPIHACSRLRELVLCGQYAATRQPDQALLLSSVLQSLTALTRLKLAQVGFQ